ncbi:hypothetical protein K439DRAFT_1364741 [Ramaria rubella]|nr:hypothetical protein K439DRAFT_1364741 [Ramaria rubella]
MTWHLGTPRTVPSHTQLSQDTQWLFNITPCIGQMHAAEAQTAQESDVVFTSGTGSGKTLIFWMLMIYEEESITIFMTPLNILRQQTAQVLSPEPE